MISENMTGHILLEARMRQTEFENLISKLLARFASCTASEVDEEITDGLQKIGHLASVENVFVNLVSTEAGTWSTVYNWFATGSPTFRDKYQNVPIGKYSWVERALLQAEAIQLNSLDDLPREAELERREWEIEGLKSQLLVALRGRGGIITGCTGFRSFSRQVQWTQDDIRGLRLLNEAIANVLERKRAEENLLESEEKYRLIFESSLSGILITHPDGLILSANSAAQRILGMTEEEIVGLRREDVVDTSDPTVESALAERTRTGKFSGELNYRRKNGSIFPVEISSVIYRNNKGEAFTSIIFQDITWRKKAEKILKQNETLYRKLALRLEQVREDERAALARELHDEMGQLLAAMRMDLSWIRRHLYPEQENVIKKVDSMQEYLLPMINQVRRIYTGLRPGLLDDLGLIAAIEAHLHDFQQRTGIATEMKTDIDETDMDSDQQTALFRIVQEALTNVLKHSKATKVSVGVSLQNGELNMHIADDGKESWNLT